MACSPAAARGGEESCERCRRDDTSRIHGRTAQEHDLRDRPTQVRAAEAVRVTFDPSVLFEELA